MKKNLFVVTSLAIIITVLFFACKKNTQNNLSEINTAQNVINNVLKAGQFHNMALEEVKKLGPLDMTNVIKIRQSLINYSERTFGGTYSDYPFSINDNLIKKDLEWVAENIVGAYASQISRDYIKQVGKILKSSSFDAPDDLFKKTNDLINKISDDSEISLAEKGLVLGTASVAQYSYTFWRKAFLDEGDAYHTFILKSIEKGKANISKSVADPNWAQVYIMASDAAGYVGGYNMIINATTADCKTNKDCYLGQIAKTQAYGVAGASEASARAAINCCNNPS